MTNRDNGQSVFPRLVLNDRPTENANRLREIRAMAADILAPFRAPSPGDTQPLEGNEIEALRANYNEEQHRRDQDTQAEMLRKYIEDNGGTSVAE